MAQGLSAFVATWRVFFIFTNMYTCIYIVRCLGKHVVNVARTVRTLGMTGIDVCHVDAVDVVSRWYAWHRAHRAIFARDEFVTNLHKIR